MELLYILTIISSLYLTIGFIFASILLFLTLRTDLFNRNSCDCMSIIDILSVYAIREDKHFTYAVVCWPGILFLILIVSLIFITAHKIISVIYKFIKNIIQPS